MQFWASCAKPATEPEEHHDMDNIDSDEDYGLSLTGIEKAETETGSGSEPEPELGPDVADIRQAVAHAAPPAKNLYAKLKGDKMPRVLAVVPKPATGQKTAVEGAAHTNSAQEARPVGDETSEIRKAFQICLDDEANLEGLEDPNLVLHMERARAEYAERRISEKRRPPNLDALKADHKRILVEINSLLRALEEQKAERQRNTDEICVHGSNAKRLSTAPTATNGPPPHGYPALKQPIPPECLEAFRLLGIQIAKDGDLSKKSVEFCEESLKSLTLLRRNIEGLLDSLWRLVEAPDSSV